MKHLFHRYGFVYVKSCRYQKIKSYWKVLFMKKVVGQIKLQIPAGKATPAPPVEAAVEAAAEENTEAEAKSE
mgnify:CR=1 FL=1